MCAIAQKTQVMGFADRYFLISAYKTCDDKRLPYIHAGYPTHILDIVHTYIHTV